MSGVNSKLLLWEGNRLYRLKNDEKRFENPKYYLKLLSEMILSSYHGKLLTNELIEIILQFSF